jgi:ataxia telangiectasia mutated family protein
MCIDHPYHCIAPLIALTNGKVDSQTRGVKKIIEDIDKSGTRYVKDLLYSYRILTAAYNDLAHVSTTRYQGSKRQKNQKIRFSEVFSSAAKEPLYRCLSRLPGKPTVITSPPILRPGKDYGGGKEDPIGAQRVARFEPDFAITESGIHRPKIVMCIGSQGGSFRQLVKGEDDIRQDAIMSQVFTYVNNLMKTRNNHTISREDPGTLKTAARNTRHKLKMITYNVLPLSPSSGVSQNAMLLIVLHCDITLMLHIFI